MRNATSLLLAVLVLHPVSATAKGPFGDIRLEVDPSGTAHAVVASLSSDVRHLSRAPGQTWRPPKVVPGLSLWPTATVFGADGSGIAAWWDAGVRAADLPYRTESMPALLNADAATGLPRVAIAEDGGAVVAWLRGERLVAAHRRRAGIWSRSVVLGPASTDASLDYGLHLVGTRDSVVAVWLDGRTASKTTVWARRWSTVSGSWEPSVAVSAAPGTVTDLVATASSDGIVGVAWVGDRGALVRELAPGGSWGTPQTLAGATASAPDLVLGPNGTGAALWREPASGGPTLRIAHRSAQGWGEPMTITGSGGEKPCSGAVARPEGETVVVWSAMSMPRCPTSPYDVVPARLLTSAQRSALAGGWSTPTQLAAAGDRPTLAVDGGGEVVAGWFSAGRPMLATRSIDGRWSAPFDAGGSPAPDWSMARAATTNARDGWRVPISLEQGRVTAQVHRVGSSAAWTRTATVNGSPGSRYLRLGQLGPGTYRVYATQRTGAGVSVLADRVFTAHFQGFHLTTFSRRIAFDLSVNPRVAINVRLERASGRRVTVVRRVNLGGSARRRTKRVVLDAVPPGRYVVRLTAVESSFRRVQLVREVTVNP